MYVSTIHTYTHTLSPLSLTVATSNCVTFIFLHLVYFESLSSVIVALIIGAVRNHSNNTTPDKHDNCMEVKISIYSDSMISIQDIIGSD